MPLVTIFLFSMSSSLIYDAVTLPLWDPSPVQIGDVGYLLKPAGAFVTLFNALKPKVSRGSSSSGFPNMAEYGNVSKGTIRMDKRNVAQKGLDAFSGFLSFRSKSEMPIVYVVTHIYSWLQYSP